MVRSPVFMSNLGLVHLYLNLHFTCNLNDRYMLPKLVSSSIFSFVYILDYSTWITLFANIICQDFLFGIFLAHSYIPTIRGFGDLLMELKVLENALFKVCG